MKLRGQPLPFLDRLRAAPSTARRRARARRLDAPRRVRARPAARRPRRPGSTCAPTRRVRALLDELEGWQELGGELSRDDSSAALERAPVRAGPPRDGPASPCSTCCAPGRGAPRSSSCSGSRRACSRSAPQPRRSSTRTGGASSTATHGSRRPTRSPARATSSTPPARGLRGGSTWCARRPRRTARPGSRARSGRSCASSSIRDDVERWTKRRSLSKLVWDGSRRRRASASACARWLRWPRRPTATPPARSPAANGWERQLERAVARLRATDRAHQPVGARGAAGPRAPSRSPSSRPSAAARRSGWSSGSSRPKRSTARWTRGCAARSRTRRSTVLLRTAEAARLERVAAEQARAGARVPARVPARGDRWRCQVRLELTELERSELEAGLWRDLEALRPQRGRVAAAARAEALRGLVRHRALRAGAPARARPRRRSTLSGKIDRIDLDPFAARGIVQDYKSGKTAHSAAQIERELQAPDPALHARPARPRRRRAARRRLPGARGRRPARGLLRAAAREDGVPGFAANDYLDEDDVLGARSSGRRRAARGFVARIRAGDVRHDPLGRRARARAAKNGCCPRAGRCPSWCRLAPLCRVPRAMSAPSAPPIPSSSAAIEAPGLVFVSAGAGTGKTTVLVERFVPRGVERGHRRRLDARDHLHRSRRRRAARPHPRPALPSAAGPSSPASSTAPGSRPSTASAAGCCTQNPFAAGVDPRFRVLDESRRWCSASRPSTTALERVLRRRRSGAARLCSSPTGARACGGCSPASTRRCARPGARSSSRSATRPGSTSGAPRSARRRRSPPTRGARARPARGCSSCSTANPLPERCSSCRSSRSGATTELRAGAEGGRAGCA